MDSPSRAAPFARAEPACRSTPDSAPGSAQTQLPAASSQVRSRRERARKRYAEDADYRARKLAQNRKWERSHREHVNEYKRLHRNTNPQFREKNRRRLANGRRMAKYGLSTEDFERMVIRQNGLCANCKIRPLETLCVDHCHATNTVRELLCRKCNTGLGCFNDSPALLRKAAGYLHRHGRQQWGLAAKAFTLGPLAHVRHLGIIVGWGRPTGRPAGSSMTVEQQQQNTDAAPAIALGPLLAAFTAAIFLSAALLFAVQPMFTKMVLPQLGGSASVWSVAIVFFQAVLLLGYAYAHLLTRYLPTRLTLFIHVAVMLVATLALPLAVAASWGRPPTEDEALWLIGLFGVSIGLPFFALSANGPLLQAWFARSDHPRAKDPYFLYAASNIGSMLALLSYPFAIEPFTRLGQQRLAWSVGFYGLIALIGACGVLLWRTGGTGRDAAVAEAAGARPSWRDAVTWMALAAVPSGLLIAVTAHLSTDIAPSPFLWVIPLAVYLATFVIVFQHDPILPHRIMVLAQPVLLVGLVATIVYTVTDYLPLVMLLHVAAFFVTAMVCHGELARRRPAAGHLTAFYMWMSAGGVIGGISAALIAPQLFS
ncbi:MAG TPA: endonuclease domain-containing protein, partial [Roseiflexaceae bacterium]